MGVDHIREVLSGGQNSRLVLVVSDLEVSYPLSSKQVLISFADE